jgi:Predicted Fe-S protein
VSDLRAASVPVPSPCTGVCRIDGASGLCIGCLRTLDEIAAWGMLGDDARRAILCVLDARRPVLTKAAATKESTG